MRRVLNILFLSRWFPFPPDNGSKIRVFNLLRGLAARHRVDLLSFFDPREGTPTPGVDGGLLRSVRSVAWKEYKPLAATAIAAFLSPTPRFLVDTRSRDMERLIEACLGRRRYDLIIASQLPMAFYRSLFQGTPAVFEEAEVGLLRPSGAESALRRWRLGLTWLKHRRFLRGLLSEYRLCTVVSESERRPLRELAPRGAAIEVVPNSVELNGRSERRARRPDRLIFVGSFRYRPNYDAMLWFLREVYPRLQSRVPGVSLEITGNHDGKPLPHVSGVILAGHVDDVRSRIAAAMVSVAPILSGGGTRLKILESMALGTPVVSTSKGAEGLDVEDGRHLLLADSAEAFAKAIESLLADADLHRCIADNAFNLTAEKYDVAVVVPRFVRLIEEVAHAG